MCNEGIFLNMNVKVRQGGRKAVKLSTFELRDKLIEYTVSKYKDDLDDPEHITIYQCIEYLMWCEGSKVCKDMKVNFDNENLDAEICERADGFAYIEITAGGDWQLPVRSYMYFDGKDIRLYVPTYGNTFNRKTNDAFGEDDEADREFLKKELKGKIEQFLDEDGEIDEFAFNDLQNEIEICDYACLKDFFDRIEIVG